VSRVTTTERAGAEAGAVSRIGAVYRWDLLLGLHNRFVQVVALACAAGGTMLAAASPGREILPLALFQALLFFGSLFGSLIGWSSGQRSRDQGAFLFAQPLGSLEIVAGKLLGTGTWCLLLLLLFLAPAAVGAATPATIFVLGGLALGFVLVYVLGGLLVGLIAAPVSGLLAVLLAWAVSVAGWELGLLTLGETSLMQGSPRLFVGLLLLNPAGAFRIATLIGLDAVPFDAAELETGRLVFENIVLFTAVLFGLWLAVLGAAATWRLDRQQF
jgi:hypothetical protein